ncbi:Dyp-type peroxidase [Kutzneria sp. NPDC052558]|uniref:Dyp-type peroxidase n=1 Tax=Kutzneria sp. NPDC052558 TaxID=3364121 RepID=UPI0037C65808
MTLLDLGEIQAPILLRRPTPYWGTMVLLHFATASAGKAFVRQVLPHVPSAADADSGQAWVSLVLTHAGLRALGVDEADLASFPAAFREGMAARADKLSDVGDSDPEHWDQPWGTGRTHAAVSLVAATEQAWREAYAKAAAVVDGIEGVELLHSHDYSAHLDSRTTFGYRDGIGYPHIEGGPRPKLPGQQTIAAGEFVLGYPGEGGALLPLPGPEILGRNGTFVGVRKVRTDVAAFRRFLRDNAPDEAGRELLAAKMVGRWRSGAPLALAPDRDDPALADDFERNDAFDYSDDARGLLCPHGAHIRRVNPRASGLERLTDVKLHRIIRQGATFGPPLPEGVFDDDGEQRGVYFLFMSARAMTTLEFLKTEWLDQGSFIGLGEEGDPIAGRHLRDDTFTVPHHPVRRRLHGLSSFTRTRGGEYGFMPSLSALDWLSRP